MNSNFSDNQIKAYAAAFEEGDAIWCGGEWREVVTPSSCGVTKTTTRYEENTYVIKVEKSDVVKFVTEGFKEEEQSPYRVTTLEHYELQGGEKLVWLGGPTKFITYGKTYETFIGSSGSILLRGDEWSVLSAYDYDGWGIIPRYDQVQPTAQKEVEASDIVNALYKRYYAGIQNMLRDDIQNALTDGDYRKVIELSKMMIEMEEKQ